VRLLRCRQPFFKQDSGFGILVIMIKSEGLVDIGVKILGMDILNGQENENTQRPKAEFQGWE
jgi:hypothetical protein